MSAPEAKFGYPEVRRGLVAAMVMTHLMRHVGERMARYLLLTGELIDAQSALQAGFINASYAMPAEQLRLRSVTQRLYRGFCDANGILGDVIARFNAARPAIDALLATDRLTARSRNHAVSFIAGSFEILDDPERRQSDIVGRCRN